MTPKLPKVQFHKLMDTGYYGKDLENPSTQCQLGKAFIDKMKIHSFYPYFIFMFSVCISLDVLLLIHKFGLVYLTQVFLFSLAAYGSHSTL